MELKKDDLISRAAAIGCLGNSPEQMCMPWSEVERMLRELPAVDAAPVVRCRDCKYGKLCFDADGHGLIQCTNTNYPAANVETWPLELDWYCAGGERRDSDA